MSSPSSIKSAILLEGKVGIDLHRIVGIDPTLYGQHLQGEVIPV